MHGDVLDPEMIGLMFGLDQADDGVAVAEQIEIVLGDRDRIVGLHRHRLAADQRHPFGVGGANEVADDVDIVACRGAKAQRVGRHLASP